MSETKLCKDCKHFSDYGYFFGQSWPACCSHPTNMSTPDLVRGSSYPVASPEDLRKADAACGEAGLMFEANRPEQEKQPEQSPYVKWLEALNAVIDRVIGKAKK